MPTLPTVTQGDDYAVTITLTKDEGTWDLTNHTVTATIRDGEHPGTPFSGVTDHAVTLTTPASGIVTLTLLDTETDTIRAPYDPRDVLVHVCDLLVVDASSNESHTEIFDIPVRRKITG